MLRIGRCFSWERRRLAGIFVIRALRARAGETPALPRGKASTRARGYDGGANEPDGDAMPAETADDRRRALRDLVAAKSLILGRETKLVSGATSRFYFDMKQTTFHPEGAALIADLTLDALGTPPPRFVAGLEMGAVPVVAAAVLRSGQRGSPLEGFCVRKAAKDHGTQRLVERDISAGARVAVVEDVTTTGGSAMQAVRAVRSAGGRVERVITVVDRLQGARQALAREDLKLIAILDAGDFDLGDARRG